ncbi:MAG: histidinol dehydrogenase [Pseudopedobacter saltans]|uniref:Histidinol dehydrogenase n=1 Tax=Pseudopedobacter saltans TaxID=151895 RepID=A0A2W5F8Q4_9SPHI|nr:MAG: histidinol dehydrogenase [Pseudopedobacter saltans]
MNIFKNPDRSTWAELTQRPEIDNRSLTELVKNVLDDVKSNGDKAILNYTEKFDGVRLDSMLVSDEELKEAETLLSMSLKSSIKQAAENIRTFHLNQVLHSEVIQTMPGIECWRKSVGIEKVGLYIPGGSAPLFSTILMLGIPAKIAGCKEVILCTPPNKEGKLHPAILYCAQLVGIHKIFKVGGVQAIGAMAYGSESIPQVYKIFGPGNQYVMCAKQLIQLDGISIDMPAGPSEVAVLADETANADFVAADLLSQAEHGPDSQVLLISIDEHLLEDVKQSVATQLEKLPRKDLAEKSLSNSKLVSIPTIEEAIALSNFYAPEHLIVSCKNAEVIGQKITNAGSVFLGNYSPESVGDYASGTNHTLPTKGYAHAYSGVSVDSFVKKITFQKLSESGLSKIANTVIEMAEAEGLQAHANAVRIRIGERF